MIPYKLKATSWKSFLCLGLGEEMSIKKEDFVRRTYFIEDDSFSIEFYFENNDAPKTYTIVCENNSICTLTPSTLKELAGLLAYVVREEGI